MYAYAEVVLPLKLRTSFTYTIPEAMQDAVVAGVRVLVSFGANKFYAGMVLSCHNQVPSYTRIKPILEVLDQNPILHKPQIQLWQWMSKYYMSNLGEIMDAALPNAFKLSSERIYQIKPNSNWQEIPLDTDAQMLADAIASQGHLKSKEVQTFFEKKSGIAVLNQLIQLGVVEPLEEVKDKYVAQYEKYIVLHPDLKNNSEALNNVFKSLEKKKKEYQVLLNYFTLAKTDVRVLKSDLIIKSEATSAHIKSLRDKNILVEILQAKDRFDVQVPKSDKQVVLSEPQQLAFDAMKQAFENHQTVLLRGITGSGKTEIYIRWLQQIFEKGGTALLVLPEIALTTQIVKRLKSYFGESMVVYHSLVSQNMKYEIWNQVAQQKIQFIVGTRSALFLPYQKLDAILIDEEHDGSLSQMEVSPRFNGRDCLIYLAHQMQSKVLLGSATPSSESYYNVLQKKYGYVELLVRYQDAATPNIHLIDLKEREKKHLMKSLFSPELFQEIEQEVAQQKQVLLFQNRRGYAPYIQCESCNTAIQCDQCDVRLTYHSTTNMMVCHYCSKTFKLKNACPTCGAQTLKTRGAGTQKVEEELGLLFPAFRISRMDADVAKSKKRIEDILNAFNQGEIDVLIGTQMISKGLDFEKLNTVGVLNADTLMSFIDYRTHEKAFQTLMQIIGRAGRRANSSSNVFLQTYHIKDKLLDFVVRQDWQGFMDFELQMRKEFIYPPFCTFIKIEMKHVREELLSIYSEAVSKKINQTVKAIVLGPTKPMIARIRNQYIRHIYIKLPKNKDLTQSKIQIQEIIDKELLLLSNKNFSIDIFVDC